MRFYNISTKVMNACNTCSRSVVQLGCMYLRRYTHIKPNMYKKKKTIIYFITILLIILQYQNWTYCFVIFWMLLTFNILILSISSNFDLIQYFEIIHSVIQNSHLILLLYRHIFGSIFLYSNVIINTCR